MEFAHKQQGKYHVLGATGRLDVATASLFEKEITACFAEGQTNLVIDMSGVEYISSAGLRGILVAAKGAKARSGEIRFCCLSGMVAEIFKISGFGKMFDIFDSIDDAVS